MRSTLTCEARTVAVDDEAGLLVNQRVLTRSFARPRTDDAQK